MHYAKFLANRNITKCIPLIDKNMIVIIYALRKFLAYYQYYYNFFGKYRKAFQSLHQLTKYNIFHSFFVETINTVIVSQ